MKTPLLIFSILLSCMFYSCSKEDMCGEPAPRGVLANLDSLGLPPATTTGENTFGCLINGEPWLPLKRNVFGTLNYQIDFSMGTISPGLFTCHMIQDFDSLESYLEVIVMNIFSEGDYTNFDLIEDGKFKDFDDSHPGVIYDIDLTYEETEVIITELDLEQEIISGTFNLRYIDDDLPTPDTLWVTSGRFDFKGN